MPQPMGAYTFVEHVPDSPEESFELDRSSATRVYDTTWADRFGFARQLLGYSSLYVLGGSRFIHRQIPHAHPESFGPTGRPYLFANRVVSCKGVGTRSMAGVGANAIATYEKARLVVQYNTPLYEVHDDTDMAAIGGGTPPDESTMLRYVTFQPRPNVDMLSINRGVFKRVDSTVPKMPVQVGISKTIVSAGFQVTWHQIPAAAVPLKLINQSIANDLTRNFAIDNCLGKVNFFPFAGYPIGTVLLLGCEIKPYKNAFGARTYDITYMFKVFNPGKDMNNVAAGHNHIFLHVPHTAIPQNATSWDWTEVTTTGQSNLFFRSDGQSTYDWDDFTYLFRPA